MKYEDVVLGVGYVVKAYAIEGLATAKMEYLGGSKRVLLQYEAKEKVLEQWFDASVMSEHDE